MEIISIEKLMAYSDIILFDSLRFIWRNIFAVYDLFMEIFHRCICFAKRILRYNRQNFGVKASFNQWLFLIWIKLFITIKSFDDKHTLSWSFGIRGEWIFTFGKCVQYHNRYLFCISGKRNSKESTRMCMLGPDY